MLRSDSRFGLEIQTKHDRRVSDLEFSTLGQLDVTRDRLAVNAGSIPASQIPKFPDTAIKEYFTMISAADFIRDNQTISRRTTDCRDLP